MPRIWSCYINLHVRMNCLFLTYSYCDLVMLSLVFILTMIILLKFTMNLMMMKKEVAQSGKG